jgi:hypothetical protein
MLSLSNRHVGGRRTHACHVAVPGLIHPRSQQSRSSKPRLATTNQGSRRTTVARRCVSAALTAPRPVRLERAFPSHGRGRRFETCYAHHSNPSVQAPTPLRHPPGRRSPNAAGPSRGSRVVDEAGSAGSPTLDRLESGDCLCGGAGDLGELLVAVVAPERGVGRSRHGRLATYPARTAGRAAEAPIGTSSRTPGLTPQHGHLITAEFGAGRVHLGARMHSDRLAHHDWLTAPAALAGTGGTEPLRTLRATRTLLALPSGHQHQP